MITYLRNVIIIFSLLISESTFAQSNDITDSTTSGQFEKVYVEQMPEPNFSVPIFLENNLRYPDDAKSNCIQGRILIRFIVNEDGKIDSVRSVFSVHPSIDEEAKRVVRAMPAWKPGRKDGKFIKVFYTLPITFRLDNDCPTEQWYYKQAEKLYEKDDLETARNYFLTAFKMNYENFMAGYNYAAVSVTLGKKDDACKMIRFLQDMKYEPANRFGDDYCK